MVLGLAGFEPVSVFEWTALSFERLTHRTAYLPIVKVFQYAVYSVVWAFALEPEAGFSPADHSFLLGL